ncbi:hypothetical protein CTKZ_20550 [Cellulomonas algicola]|uniref:HipA N-terminal subdomain 1 domain-containing protein n=1 Tax=Cellulomonas algicola TaxID=2071633 RepID=A0A401V0R2_9CELL|nr:HipA N-terminal domain-containing protein [Cellulomonas algicola]GCD20493.1 hypothetical protein CTKZ_20550 [Cellulomonas algicola]
MSRTLDVHLDGVRAGTLTMTAGGALGFRYEETYRAGADPTPLSLSMPLTSSVHEQRAVLPFLQGLLPDNEQALEAMARRFQVSARSPFALLEHMGHDVAGALQFVRPGEASEDARADRSDLTPVDDQAIADELLETIQAYRTGRPPAHVWGRISLAGAQPKIALVRAVDGSWLAPGRGVPTTHILKPSSRRPTSATPT